MTIPPLLVLAGGFGTRLRSVVPDLPKPLAPVANAPYLHYLIRHWQEQGVGKLIFLLHYQAEAITAFLQSQQASCADMEMEILIEPQPLGTGGAVAHAVRQCGLKDTFMVTNADTWLDLGLHQVSEAQAPAMGIVHVDHAGRFGCVRTAQERIVAFAEKDQTAGAGWINAGLYHLHANAFADWNGQPFSLERDLFPTLAAAGQLQGIPLDTDFIDIGVPEDYARFCRWIESGREGTL